MPLPGDQHRDTHATVNPFAEHRPHVTEYTAQEIATLQARLDKQLGPEYISTRPGNGGGRVHYLAAEKVINLANEVFGFNGWSSAIQNVQIDFVDENRETGKITLGLSTIVRVTLRDGTFHEDVGYGHIENCKGKAAAFEKAKKEAATDALKRALRNFGNVLGNCLYDKDYLQKVTKVKIAPSKWDAENLHRHPDYAPIKKESIADAEAQEEKAAQSRRQISNNSAISFNSNDFEDDFGGSGLDDVDFTHPDEVKLDDTVISNLETQAQRMSSGVQPNGQRYPASRMQSTPQIGQPNMPHPQHLQAPQKLANVPRLTNNAGNTQSARVAPMPPPVAPHPQKPQPPSLPAADTAQRLRAQAVVSQPLQHDGTSEPSNSSSATTLGNSPKLLEDGPHVAKSGSAGLACKAEDQQPEGHGLPVPGPPPPGVPEGFVTGRSADLLNQATQAKNLPAQVVAFNPHADSPSIRRTVGVNPGRSAPVSRQAIQGQANAHQAAPPPSQTTSNGLNGATTAMRTNFVDPSADLHRRIGAPGLPGGLQNRGSYRPPSAVGLKRPPLADVSNVVKDQNEGDGTISKKPKVDA